ncbi:hypothetical protein BJV74DRAFT_711316, partial [Russula compacta]
MTFMQQWATQANENKQKLMEANIPKEYHRHAKVFLEEAAKALPPLCEENFTINLKPDAPSELMCKIYPLNQQELEVLRENLQKDREKGYICHRQ